MKRPLLAEPVRADALPGTAKSRSPARPAYGTQATLDIGPRFSRRGLFRSR